MYQDNNSRLTNERRPHNHRSITLYSFILKRRTFAFDAKRATPDHISPSDLPELLKRNKKVIKRKTGVAPPAAKGSRARNPNLFEPSTSEDIFSRKLLLFAFLFRFLTVNVSVVLAFFIVFLMYYFCEFSCIGRHVKRNESCYSIASLCSYFTKDY